MTRHRETVEAWRSRGFDVENVTVAKHRPSFSMSVLLTLAGAHFGAEAGAWLRKSRAPVHVLKSLLEGDLGGAPEPDHWPRPDAWRVRMLGDLLLVEAVEVECSRNRDIEVIAHDYLRRMFWDLDREPETPTAAVIYTDYARGDPPKACLWHFQAGDEHLTVVAAEAAELGAPQFVEVQVADLQRELGLPIERLRTIGAVPTQAAR